MITEPFVLENKNVYAPAGSGNNAISSPTGPDSNAVVSPGILVDNAINFPSITSDESIHSDSDEGETKKKRSANKDRSMNLYSLEDFYKLPIAKQIELASQYGYSTTEFESSGLFQFAYGVFTKSLSEHGFERAYVYKGFAEDTDRNASDVKCLYIDHGKRGDTVEKKITLNSSTCEKLNRFLDSTGRPLSNSEKSKVLDAILSSSLDDLLSLEETKKLHLAYRPQEGECLI